MAFTKAFIPYGAYWSTPFVRWQGSFASQHAMKFAGEIAQRALAEREIPPEVFETIVFGMTVPQHHCFYGGPWMGALVGAPTITGPFIGQACATSAKCVETAAREVEAGDTSASLVITADRCSNGMHIYYPNPLGPGGKGDHEDWVWDNFSRDPWAKQSMIQTAENVAKEAGITREQVDECTLMRSQQYEKALENDRAFQKKYMVTPIEIKAGKKTIATVEGDEGVFPTSKEGLARLKPVLPEGVVTFGAQTFPADGNCGIVVTNEDKARELSRDKSITIRILSYAQARAEKAYMAKAIVPAGDRALERAGVAMKDMKAIKTHTPFAVNDVYFCRNYDLPLDAMNNYGCSLIYGHPQGPTGARTIIELIEELVLLGGGYGMFNGCAAGDTGAAIIFKVDV
ncbi:MAG: thiolase family protein [Deltaproteobacteria bacterium]|nr:thiolase family protein [Deltaproteobacteria bacterium]